MDKSWINAPRVSDAYKNGCMSFIQFARHMEAQETILCPCLKCCNDKRFSTENVLHHILFYGFPWWLQEQVSIMEKHQCDEETIALARGPSSYAKRYKIFKINGFKFHTKDQESNRKTQNSGVVVEVKEGYGENTLKKYYGSIIDMYELDYYGKGNVVIFRCEWVNINSSKGFKQDKYGHPLVSFSKLIHTGEALKDDPFVLSTDAKQVFYVQDGKDSEWMHIVETKPRDLYDMGSLEEDGDDLVPEACL